MNTSVSSKLKKRIHIIFNDFHNEKCAVAVLSNVITGIGLLGIPYCFCAGIATNMIIVLIIASFSMFSFLIYCASKTGVHDYPRLITKAFPRRNLQWIPDIIIIITFISSIFTLLNEIIFRSNKKSARNF